MKERIASIDRTLIANGAIVVIGILLAIALRASLIGFESRDYEIHVGEWYAQIKESGFSALKSDFSNYTPLYLYLLYFVTLVFPDLPNVVGIKLISIIFDFVGAFFAYKLVRLKYNEGPIPLFAFLAFLFAPTVVLNGSMWGQADIIFTSGLLACVYFVLTQREKFAFIAFGLAFALKLQAIFIAPVLGLLFLKRLISWRGFLLIPVIYLILLLPSLVIGRPWLSLLTIYVDQANSYDALSLNAPNIYLWFPKESYGTMAVPGIIFGAAVIFLFVSLAYCSRAAISAPHIIELMTLSVLISPYVFPKMHERYFFPADVFSIIFAFYFPRYVLLAVGVSLISVFTYVLYLFGNETIPLSILAILLLFIIGTMGFHLIETLYGESGTQK